MAWFLRKSLKLGPLRLNLSKSGLGLSAGIKGLRAGIDAKGRKYVAGGRGGLYFRTYVKPGEQEAPTSPPELEPARPRRWGWVVLAIVAVLVAIEMIVR